jgi:hypothetical protein
MVSTSPLNCYLTIKKIREYVLLKIETIKNNCKLRFEMNEHVLAGINQLSIPRPTSYSMTSRMISLYFD